MNTPAISSLRRSGLLIPLGIVLIGANLRAPLTAIGPVLGDIQVDLHLSDSAAGLLNSLPLIIFALLSLAAPAFGRKAGVERGLGVALISIFLGTVLRSAPSPVALWSGTLVLSAGIAIANVLLPGLVKREFPDRAALLIGLYAAAMASAAGLAAGLAVPIAHLAGSNWRVSIGLPAILALATCTLWIRPMLGTQHKLSMPTPTTSASPWKLAIGWQVSLFFACHSFVFYSLVSWYAAIANTRGETVESAGFDLLLYQIVAVAANLASAPLIKRTKDQRAMGLLCGGCLVIGTTGLFSSAPMPTLWLMIAGLGAGFSMTTSLSLFALRTTTPQQAAQLSGMAQFVGYAGAAIGPVLFGSLHGASPTWALSLGTLIVASLSVTVFAVLAGRNRVIK